MPLCEVDDHLQLSNVVSLTFCIGNLVSHSGEIIFEVRSETFSHEDGVGISLERPCRFLHPALLLQLSARVPMVRLAVR